MPIELVMFDVGGVLIRTPFEMAARYEHTHGMARGALGLWGPFDPQHDLLWQQVMAEVLDEDSYWEMQATRLASVLGLEGEDLPRQLMNVLFSDAGDVVRPEVDQVLDTLASRHERIGVLSNHLQRFHQPGALANLIDRFDPVVDLSFAPVRKPAPSAFLAAAEATGIGDPSRILHVDDQPSHIAGARRAGLSTLLFDPTEPSESFTRLLDLAPGHG